jgi:hypothetical protein
MLEWKRVRHVYEDTVYIAYFDIHSIIQIFVKEFGCKIQKNYINPFDPALL